LRGAGFSHFCLVGVENQFVMIFGQGKVLFPFLAQRKRRRLHSSGLKTFLKKNITQTLALIDE